jgi:hypothetical protein
LRVSSTSRRLLVLLLVVLAAAVGAGAAHAIHGGTYTTSTGEQVRVFLSDRYPVDPARNQSWAEFLVRLVHGPEVETVTLLLAPPSELAFYCGRDALACYEPGRGTIYASADRVTPEVSPEATIVHEYGHHVAASRLNIPWPAIDWGTKRWATYMGICAAAEAGDVAPGDEGSRYAFNPGEAFAEVYRVLNERRLGLAETPWEIVDNDFVPDETALRLLEEDVLSPWQAATTLRRTGRAIQTRPGTVKFSTPLDGRLAATVRSATPVQVELVVGGTVLSRATGRIAAVRATVCGTRSASLRIRSVTGAVRYTATIARP